MKPEDAKRLQEIRANHEADWNCTGDCDHRLMLRVIDEQGKEVERLTGAIVDIDRECDSATPNDHRCAKEGCDPCKYRNLDPLVDAVQGIVARALYPTGKDPA